MSRHPYVDEVTIALRERPQRTHYNKRHRYYFAVIWWQVRVAVIWLGSARGF